MIEPGKDVWKIGNRDRIRTVLGVFSPYLWITDLDDVQGKIVPEAEWEEIVVDPYNEGTVLAANLGGLNLLYIKDSEGWTGILLATPINKLSVIFHGRGWIQVLNHSGGIPFLTVLRAT